MADAFAQQMEGTVFKTVARVLSRNVGSVAHQNLATLIINVSSTIN
jgi:hypothetical protein